MSTYSRSHDTGSLISTEFQRAASGQLRNPLYAAADPPASGRCPTARGPSELPARYSRSSKLLQVTQIVLIEEPDIGRAGTEHREALDAAAEGETLIFGRVIADAPQHVRMHHAAAGRFNPA